MAKPKRTPPKVPGRVRRLGTAQDLHEPQGYCVNDSTAQRVGGDLCQVDGFSG